MGIERLQITLLADPELWYTATGKAIARAKAETVDEKEYIMVIAWEEKAERMVRELKKGDTKFFNGKFKIRKWTDRNGDAHQIREFVL